MTSLVKQISNFSPVKKKKESSFERDACASLNTESSRAFKFVSPGTRGMPDRLVLSAIPEEHREIVAKYVRFIEFKSSAGKLSAEQTKIISLLQRWGFQVDIKKP
jgi:VRR-NUC domain